MTAKSSGGGMPPAVNRLFKFIFRSPYDAPFYGLTLDEKKNPRHHEVEAGAQTTVIIRGALY